ncbi:MAG: hypothetical protein WKG32_14050 [Gemmatimonadaceae bacterium]
MPSPSTTNLPLYKVTPIGVQVLALGTAQPHTEYLRVVGESICTLGFNVHLGRYLRLNANQIRYFADTPLCPAAAPSEHTTATA